MKTRLSLLICWLTTGIVSCQQTGQPDNALHYQCAHDTVWYFTATDTLVLHQRPEGVMLLNGR